MGKNKEYIKDLAYLKTTIKSLRVSSIIEHIEGTLNEVGILNIGCWLKNKFEWYVIDFLI